MSDFIIDFYKANEDLFKNSEYFKNKKENNMGIKVKNFYETSDGEVFEDLKDAEKHEAEQENFLKSEVQSKLDYIEKLIQERNFSRAYWAESGGCVELKVYFS
jgi:hypothetical protein